MAGEIPKVPYKPKGFFQKGNTYSKGRPRISLSKPDLLLPAIFGKAKINWANDFARLYRTQRERALDARESAHFKMLLDLLPYLIVKLNMKEDELRDYLKKGAAEKQVSATNALLASLEAERGAKPGTTEASGKGGVGTGESVLPPPAEPTKDL